MTFSLFDIFKIGIGPSSSHTMGPMLAAKRFCAYLQTHDAFCRTERLLVTLYGSLALTGKGHGTDRALIAGLAGFQPDSVAPADIERQLAQTDEGGQLRLDGVRPIAFRRDRDIVWQFRQRLPKHHNAMTFAAFDNAGAQLAVRTYYSVGGGFVQDEDEIDAVGDTDAQALPHAFDSAAELLQITQRERLDIAAVVWKNEIALRPETVVRDYLDKILQTMDACIVCGMTAETELAGGLRLQRRASRLRAQIQSKAENVSADPLVALDWINVWAMAVGEENAAGGRVVTAPTNGAAGIIPAVLRYHRVFNHGTRKDLHRFLLTAAAVGLLYKRNASISAAEVGCQGEVGVASSMAAAGLAAATGCSNAQIENAAEIAMEHNLGLTCDPIKGLVQIPCIERNAMGAVKAIDAAKLARLGDGIHRVSLDGVIDAMRRTGADMRDSYKETSLGGLAVNFIEC